MKKYEVPVAALDQEKEINTIESKTFNVTAAASTISFSVSLGSDIEYDVKPKEATK